jgi:hypothetical protein
VFSICTNCPNKVFFVWLVDLKTICAKYGLETCLTPNVDIRIYLFDSQCSWSKYAIWNMNIKKWSKLCIIVSRTAYHFSVYEIKPLFASTNEIQVLALDIQLIIGQYGFGIWHNLSHLITVLALVTKLTCAHNGHQLSISRILCLIGRSKDYLCSMRSGNLSLSKWWYSYMFARQLALLN